MFKDIKVYVPTEEISAAVQEKLFESGCQWPFLGGKNVQQTHSKFLYVDGNGIVTQDESDREYFDNSFEQQLHYLQILAGDTEGVGYLFKIKYVNFDKSYYQFDGKTYWFDMNKGKLRGTLYPINIAIEQDLITKFDVNENELEEDMNKMPELEAGKHVVKLEWEHREPTFYLVLQNKEGRLFGKQIDDETGFTSSFDDMGKVVEVHTLAGYESETFDPSAYNQSTLIWQREDESKRKLRQEYEDLKRQVDELNEKVKGMEQHL